MPGLPEFKREQRGVALAMLAALTATIVVLGLVAMRTDRTAAGALFADRLQAVIRIDLLVIAWLAASIANVARLRFFSERDIAGSSAGTGSEEIRRAGAVLQNTFEQTALAIFAHLVVAATFAHAIPLVMALACLFAAGRSLFWAGYKYGARGRAFGFALTFYPSVLALVASGLTILLGRAA